MASAAAAAQVLMLLLTTLAYPRGVAGDFSDAELAGAVTGTFVGTLLLCAGLLGAGCWCYLRRLRRNDGRFKRDPENPKTFPTADDSVLAPPKPPRLTSSSQPSSPNSDVLSSATENVSGDSRAIPVTVSLLCTERDDVGLGFHVVGDETGAVFVGKVAEHGPAFDTGNIQPGDRLLSLTVSTVSMALEDALTIFSYSSPYPVQLSLLPAAATTATSPASRTPLFHRSWSADQLASAGQRRRPALGHLPPFRPPALPHGGNRRRSDVISEHFDRDLAPRRLHATESLRTARPAYIEPRTPTSQSHHSLTGNSNSDVQRVRDSIQRLPTAVQERCLSAKPRQTTGPFPQQADTNKDIVVTEKCLEVMAPVGEWRVSDNEFQTRIVAGKLSTVSHEAGSDVISIENEPNIATEGNRGRRKKNTSGGDAMLVAGFPVNHLSEKSDRTASEVGSDGGELGGGVRRFTQASPSGRATADDSDSEVFFDVPQKPTATAKKRLGLLGSLRSLLKTSGAESGRRRGRASSFVGGAVPYRDPEDDDDEADSQQTNVVYVAKPQLETDNGSHDQESRLHADKGELHKEAGTTMSKLPSPESNGLPLSTLKFDKLMATDVESTKPRAADLRRKSDSSCSDVADSQPAHATSDESHLRHDLDHSGTEEAAASDAGNFPPSSRSEELKDSTLQATAVVADDIAKECDVVAQSQVDDDDAVLVVGADAEVNRAIDAVFEELKKAEKTREISHDQDSSAVNQHAAENCADLEAQFVVVQPPPSTFQTDATAVALVECNDAETEKQAEVASSEPEPLECTDVSRTTDKQDKVNMLRESPDADTELAASAQTAETEDNSLVTNANFDVQLGAENAHFVEELINSVGDEEQCSIMRLSDAESDRHLGLNRQHLDVAGDHSPHLVDVHVTKPSVSTSVDVRDTNHTIAARQPVVEDKKSLDKDFDLDLHSVISETTGQVLPRSSSNFNDRASPIQSTDVKDETSLLGQVDGVTTDDLRYSTIIETPVKTPSQTMSDLSLAASDTTSEVFEDKRSSGLDLGHSAAEISSDAASALNLSSVEVEENRSERDRASSGHCVVTMDTPTITSGPARSSPTDDIVTIAHTNVVEAKTEKALVDSRTDHDTVHSVISKQPPAESGFPEGDTQTPAGDNVDAISRDKAVKHPQDTVETSTKSVSVQREGDKESITNLQSTLSVNEEVDKTPPRPEEMVQSISEVNLPDKYPLPEPVCIRSRTLAMGADHSHSTDVTTAEQTPQTATRLADKQQIAADPAVHAGNHRQPNSQNSDTGTVRQPQIAGVPTVRLGQLPMALREGTAPKTEELKRNFLARSSPNDFTFVVQRQFRVSRERSLSSGKINSTGSSSGGNGSRKPVYTFVMPAVRSSSVSDHNNNEFSTGRRSGTAKTAGASGGQKFVIRHNSLLALPNTVADLRKHDAGQAADSAAHPAAARSRLPILTGTGNSFDRKQVYSTVGNSAAVSGRLSQSALELNAVDTSSRALGDGGQLSQMVIASPPVDALEDKTGRSSCSETEHITNSLPDLMPTWSDDLSRAERRRNADDDVFDHVTRLRPDVGNARPLRGVQTINAHQLSRSGPDPDVTTSHGLCRSVDVGLSLPRLEHLGEEDSTEAKTTAEEVDALRISRSTIQLNSGSDGGGGAEPANSRRRPRRRRVVSLSHSSPVSSAADEVAPPTLTERSRSQTEP